VTLSPSSPVDVCTSLSLNRRNRTSCISSEILAKVGECLESLEEEVGSEGVGVCRPSRFASGR
jgi:hypothetical protein